MPSYSPEYDYHYDNGIDPNEGRSELELKLLAQMRESSRNMAEIPYEQLSEQAKASKKRNEWAKNEEKILQLLNGMSPTQWGAVWSYYSKLEEYHCIVDNNLSFPTWVPLNMQAFFELEHEIKANLQISHEQWNVVRNWFYSDRCSAAEREFAAAEAEEHRKWEASPEGQAVLGSV